MYPVVQNNLISTKEDGTGAELNVVEILEARVDVDTGSAGGALEPYSFAFPTFITLMPGDSAPLPVIVIPTNYASILATVVQGSTDAQAVVTARVKFLYQLGGRRAETHQIDFPVVICNGCLIRSAASCDSGYYTSVTATGNPCHYAQDAPMECCQDPAGMPICPAVDTSTGE